MLQLAQHETVPRSAELREVRIAVSRPYLRSGPWSSRRREDVNPHNAASFAVKSRRRNIRPRYPMPSSRGAATSDRGTPSVWQDPPWTRNSTASRSPPHVHHARAGRWRAEDIVEAISHGPRGDIVSVYTTFPWPVLCAEGRKLKIEPTAVRIPRGLADRTRYTAVTGEQSSRNRWTKVATLAGFELADRHSRKTQARRGLAQFRE
jgi:hypothetical protein